MITKKCRVETEKAIFTLVYDKVRCCYVMVRYDLTTNKNKEKIMCKDFFKSRVSMMEEVTHET